MHSDTRRAGLRAALQLVKHFPFKVKLRILRETFREAWACGRIVPTKTDALLAVFGMTKRARKQAQKESGFARTIAGMK